MTNRLELMAAASLLGLCACERADGAALQAASAPAAVDCVDLPEGTPLVARDGVLFAAATVPAASLPPASGNSQAADAALARQLTQRFADRGFGWMGLQVREDVATLTGTAPNAAAKRQGFGAGEQIILAHPRGGTFSVIADAISVEGGTAGVGEALAELSRSDITPASCQRAFDATMDGQAIAFGNGAATIERGSAALLDALTGAATLCARFGIEVEGHASLSGDAALNQSLSDQRAAAVRQYFIDAGVPAGSLTATGYGETQPLVQAETAAANAQNRRVEFSIGG